MRPAEDRVDQRAGEAVQGRGAQQQLPPLRRLPAEHLGDQVGQRVLLPGRAGGQRAALPAVPEREAAEHQTGRPARGPVQHAGDGAVRGHGTGHGGEQLAGLVVGEPQVRLADLGQPAAGPQPGQPDRRLGAAGEHHPQRRRLVVEQELQALGHPAVGHLVQVVEDQQQWPRDVGQPVEQLGDGDAQRIDRRDGEGRQRAPGRLRCGPGQRRRQVGPEPGRVVVAAVQGQPGDRAADGAHPGGQQGGLAPAGARGDHGDRGATAVEEPGQPGPGHQGRGHRRHPGLGGEQGAGLGHGVHLPGRTVPGSTGWGPLRPDGCSRGTGAAGRGAAGRSGPRRRPPRSRSRDSRR